MPLTSAYWPVPLVSVVQSVVVTMCSSMLMTLSVLGDETPVAARIHRESALIEQFRLFPASFLPRGVEPPAGVGQRVHSVPLPRQRLGEMPLSGDFVPARFHTFGVECAQHVVSGLHGGFGVC